LSPRRSNSSLVVLEARHGERGGQGTVARLMAEITAVASEAHAGASSAAVWREVSSAGVFPDSLMTVWLVLLCICVFRIRLLGGSDYEARSLQVRERRDSLQGAYVLAMADIEGILVNMSESAVGLAEWNFNEKRRGFMRSLDRIAEDPETYFPKPTKATIDAFRTLVSLWLRLYEECTEDPLRNPKRVIEPRELNKCKRMSDIARLVVSRLEKNPVSFVRRFVSDGGQDAKHIMDEAGQQPWLQVFCGFGCSKRAASSKMCEDGIVGMSAGMGKGSFPLDCVMGCIRLTVLSKTHVSLLAMYLAGLSLLALELVLCNWLSTITVSLSEVYLLSGLFRIRDIDEISRLQLEVARLEKMGEEVKEHRNMLVEFYTNLRDLNALWQYRTLPCLEYLEAGTEHILKEKDASFMQDATKLWCQLFDGLGGIPLWMERTLDEEVLVFAAEQLKSATDCVIECSSRGASAAILQRLANVFGFVVVRVRAANSLTTKGYGKLVAPAEPFVTISISDDQKPLNCSDAGSIAENAFRTEAMKGCTDPRWEDEEFFVPVEWYNSHLQLHVWDSQPHGEPISLGFHNIAFRALAPGVWHQKCEYLTSAKSGSETQSAIDFEIFFANEVRQLDWAEASRKGEAKLLPGLLF